MKSKIKILQSPNYISIPTDKIFSKLITGYGLMTLDIANSVSQANVNVDLFTISCITKGQSYNHIKIIKHRWIDIVNNTRITDILKGIRLIVKDKPKFRLSIRILYYYSSLGYFRKIIKDNNYDIIHFHGIGYANLPFIEYCISVKQKIMVTLHGLNSFSDSVKISYKEKLLEKDFLKMVANKNIPVTVISSGIKRKILSYLNLSNSKNFFVVTNGCNLNNTHTPKKIDIRKKYNIADNKLIILCVGNISVCKNQIQVVKAFKLLPDKIQEQLVILFLGNDNTNGRFEKEVAMSGQRSNLIYCRSIPRTDLDYYYSQADFNVVASISEGFGLSIIEGFSFGLPTLIFSDLDAIPDLYDEKAMLTIEERTDKALAEGIKEMIKREWNNQYIKQYALKFSLDVMGLKYVEIYNRIINE